MSPKQWIAPILISVGLSYAAINGIPIVTEAVAQASCPVALPNTANFTGPSITQGQFKAALNSLVSFLGCQLGTDGTTSGARSALGLATVASTGNFNDLTNKPSAGNSFPVGSVVMWAGVSQPPAGWLWLDGQAISRSKYLTLFNNGIGTNFGPGDGATTFNLPDLRGRAAIGVNWQSTTNGVTGAYSVRNMGQSGGTETRSLQVSDIPTGPVFVANGAFSIGAVGGGAQTPLSLMQPYFAIGFIIWSGVTS